MRACRLTSSLEPGEMPGAAARRAPTRRAIVAAVAGNALEFYDFTIYAFFAVTIGRTFFPVGNDQVNLLASVAAFGVGFVTRPLGGLVIGAYADRAGRKPAMMLTIALMAAGMLLLAVTPGYATIGVAAPVVVVASRLVQGFALGGEVGPSTAYLIESAPPGRRGAYASWQLGSQGCSILVAGLVGVALSQILPETAMASWGWRVPVLLGLLVVPVGLYMRHHLPETAPRSQAADHGVLFTLISANGRALAIAVPLLLCGTVSTYVGTYMTTYATTTLKMSGSASIAATAVVGACVLVFSVAGGWLADRFGRRVVMIVPRALLVVSAYPAFLLMVTAPSTTTLLAMSAVIAAFSALSTTASLVVVAELLPRRVRSAGLSITYAVVVALFGGTTQLVVTWLLGVSGDPLSPAYYLMATSSVGLVAMVVAPETGRLDLA